MTQEDKIKEALLMIEEGVKNVYSSDNYKQYLSFLTKFHNYSFNNTMLILSQKPDASMVAGFYSWKENFHRYVNKGEKAIQILAPYQVDITKEVTKTDENGFVLTDDKGQELTEEKKIKVTNFIWSMSLISHKQEVSQSLNL